MSQNCIKMLYISRVTSSEYNRLSQNYIKTFSNFSECFLAANEKRVSQNFIKVFFKMFRTFLAAKQKRVSQNFFKLFQLFRTFPRSQSNASVSKFNQGILKCSTRFFAANEKRVSQNFIKVIFFNFPHVSSQPSKIECPRISSKYFSTFPHVSLQPIKSECLKISSWFLKFFLHVSSQPMKSECLRISSRYFFKFSARFLAANKKRVSQNFIEVFFKIFCTFPRSQ